MRVGLLTASRAALLAGPAAIAFFTGGYLTLPRLWAGIGVWALLLVALALVPDALPRRAAGRAAALALGGLAAWTLASVAWAPVAGTAYHAGQLTVLYAGGLLAAAALLRDRRALASVEPALALGTVVVVGYGLSERLLPGLLSFARSQSALGRLEQPVTYWNAMGAIAALGVVLCARLSGDPRRPGWLRAVAVAAAAPLGMGLWLTVSRGALFACGAGLVALAVAAARREQLTGGGLAVGTAALGAGLSAPLDAVRTLAGTPGVREGQGAIALAGLLVLAAAGAVGRLRLTAREGVGGPSPTAAAEGAGGPSPTTAAGGDGGPPPRRALTGPLRLPRHAGVAAAVVVLLGFAAALALGAHERRRGPLSPSASRFGTLESNRYAYWRVARRSFARQPLRGVGAGGWAVDWLRERPFAEGAVDAHSLYVQTGAELGLVGLALLAAFLAGVGLSARAALRRSPEAAAGLLAACVVWAAHVALDWDFQMPAATLPALVCAGALLALADGIGPTAPRRSAVPPVGTPRPPPRR